MSIISLVAIAYLSSWPSAGEPSVKSFEDFVRRSAAGLLHDDGVRAELKFTAEQQATLQKALEPLAKRFASERPKSIVPATPESTQKEAQFQAEMTTGIRDALKATFTAAQLARFRQIELQGRGYGLALAEKDVQTAVNFTADQRKKLTALTDEYEKKRSRLIRNSRGVETVKTIPGTDIPATGQDPMTGATLASLRKEFNLSAKQILTNTQLNRWYEVVGKPYPAMKK